MSSWQNLVNGKVPKVPGGREKEKKSQRKGLWDKNKKGKLCRQVSRNCYLFPYDLANSQKKLQLHYKFKLKGKYAAIFSVFAHKRKNKPASQNKIFLFVAKLPSYEIRKNNFIFESQLFAIN